MAFFIVKSAFINKKTGELIDKLGSFFETDEEHGTHLIFAGCLEKYEEPAKIEPAPVVSVVVTQDKKKK